MRKLLSCMLMITMVLGLGLVSIGTATDNALNYYSVLFKEGNIPADFEANLSAWGGTLVSAVPEVGFAQISGDTALLQNVKGMSSVQAVNPAIHWALPENKRFDFEGQVDNNTTNLAPLWGYQWDIREITENGASYELGTGSHDVIVGIIDTGIDRDHPDLTANLMPGSKNFVPAGGFQGTEPYESGDPNEFDDKHGHGTHVAGSIAANGFMLGVAPDVGVRSYRVFGLSSAESGWIIDAIVAAADDGVDVISMSLGGFDILGQIFQIDPETGEKIKLGNDVADFVAYQRAIKYAQDSGCVVVVSAGNDAMNCTNKKEVTDFLNEEYGEDGLYFVGAGFNVPACYPGVVTVSATGPTEWDVPNYSLDDRLSLYSNYGPGFINITAPGGDYRVYMECLSNGTFDQYIAQRLFENEFCFSCSEIGTYYWSIGTSMSAPKVSAVAALLIDKYGKQPPHKIAELLYKKGVVPVNGVDKIYYGNGYLNAFSALK